MKNMYIAGFLAIVLGLMGEVSASEVKDATISIYGVGASTEKQVDRKEDSSTGVGIMYDSEKFKMKVEATSDFIRTGAMVKFNPNNGKFYLKLGANYINHTMYAPDNTNADVNQYSGALASGYMMMDDLYIELGGSYTNLDGAKIGTDYEMLDEVTKQAYIEVAKRWESSLGTLDTSANAGQVYHDFTDNEATYGLGIDYYPVNNAKFGYKYQYEQNNIVNTYSAQYSFVFVEYTDNISRDTYDVKAGIAIAFDNLFDFSTYRAPANIKPHLSGLHRFEQIVFTDNMRIQSTYGVQKTAEAIARDANSAPVWTASSYNTGLTIDDADDADRNILDLATVSSDADGDTITYSIVSVSVPYIVEQSAWNNSVYIDSGVLKVHNLQTNDPDVNGDVTVTVRASDGSSSNDTTITFTFNNVQ